MVSVIVPNYNHGQFLEERIESILNQTCQDFELIILDDCSTDNSRTIIEKYRNHPKTSAIVYNTRNSGSPFQQWKKGIDLAKGEFIWIAESDDSASPLLLEKLLPLLEDKHVSMAFSDSITIDENSSEIPGWKTLIKVDNQEAFVVLDGNSFLKENMIFGNRINNASAVIFKATNAKKITGYECFNYSGDRFFWCNLMFNASFAYLNIKLNYFRQHQNRATPTGVKRGDTYLESLEVVDTIFDFLSAGMFFRMYVGGYYSLFLHKRIRYVAKDMKIKILNKYKEIFPNVVFCIGCFVFRKILDKCCLNFCSK